MILPAVRETADLAHVLDPHNAAQMVLYMGTQDLPGIPQQKVTIDEETGEIVEIEPELHYIHRVWKELDRQDKGEVVYAGLQKASNLKEGLNDGIQLVVWRAYDRGWWVATDSNGGDDSAFRVWVKEVIVPEGASTTEATQLASTILNLCWLRDNDYGGLPLDPISGRVELEIIFADRSLYNRWRRVASPLRQLIENLEHGDEEAQEKLEDLIGAVNDPEKGLDDLDTIRSNPRLPEAIFEIEDRDEVGRHRIKGIITDAQLNHLRMKLKGSARFLLQGESYGVKNLVLVEYRLTPGEWNKRTWDSGWTDWEPCETPELDGMYDGVPLIDKSLAVEYHRQWEEEE